MEIVSPLMAGDGAAEKTGLYLLSAVIVSGYQRPDLAVRVEAAGGREE